MLYMWLPMNGNLEQQGCSNVIADNINAVIDNNGKIGKCYSFNGTNQYINLQNIDLNGWPELSICCWCYPTADFNDIFLTRGGGAHRFKINANGFVFRDTNNSAQRVIALGQTIPINTWTHITCTYNRGEVYIYCNGIQTNHSTTYYHDNSTLSLDLTEYRIARAQTSSGSTYYSGKLNDFRIYNHALSAAEVREISQGLVLHYKLDSPYLETTTNLLTEARSYPEETVFTITHATSTTKYVNAGTIASSVGNNIITYSVYIINNSNTYIYPRIRGMGADGSTWGGWINGNSITAGASGWTTVTINMTNTESYNGTSVYVRWQLGTGRNAIDNNPFFYHAQLEIGDHRSPWVLGGATRQGIVEDSSGYNHNGTITGDITLNSNTPRYSASSLFNGTERITTTTPGADIRTLSCWCKTTKNSNTSQIFVADSFSGMCISFYKNNVIGVFGTTRSTGSKSVLGTAYKENDWNHIAVVKTGDTGTRNIYCNGIKLTPTTDDYWSAATGFFVGARNASNTNPYYGYLSDVRAYVTPLDADAIRQLYEVSAKVDNKQNLHTFELIENNSKIQITKQGQIKCNELQENEKTKFYQADQIIETNEFIEL